MHVPRPGLFQPPGLAVHALSMRQRLHLLVTPQLPHITNDIHGAGANSIRSTACAHSNAHDTTVAVVFCQRLLSAACAVGERGSCCLVDRHRLGFPALFKTVNWLFASALGHRRPSALARPDCLRFS